MIKILDFPTIRQSTNYSCICAALQACLCYYGIDRREKQLMNEMNVNKNTIEMHPRKIIKIVQKYQLKAIYKKLTIDDLINYIKKDIPIIVNFQAWGTSKKPDYIKDNNGHYAVVIGFDNVKKILIFSDPSSYNKCYIPYDEFEHRWHDGSITDYDYEHMGVVIWGRPPKFNNKKLIKLK